MNSSIYSLIKANLILLLFFLIFGGLYIGRAFLIPLAYAGLLAMLMTPLCMKLEKKVNKALSAFICVLLLVLFFAGLGALLSAQIASFSQDLPQIEQQINQRLTELQQFVQDEFGVSPEKQKEAVKESSSPGGVGIRSVIVGFIGSFTSIMANFLLALVYIFLLLYYRSRFKTFILKIVSDENRDNARRIINDSSQVAQQYLLGRGMLIIILTLLYSIGLSIIGLKNAILLSIIAGLLSIIPYIGNIIGVAFPLFMALVQGGDMWLFINIIIIFSVIQFVESYTLEPYVVGAEVDIHPFFTIVIIIVGELIWGVSGMILAIPILGIVKIIFSNIHSLKPYAYLIGNAGGDSGGTHLSEKIKKLFS